MADESPRFVHMKGGSHVAAIVPIAVGAVVAIGTLVAGEDLGWGRLAGFFALAAGIGVGIQEWRGTSVRVFGDQLVVRNRWRERRVPVSDVKRIAVVWAKRRWVNAMPSWRGQAYTTSGVIRLQAFDTLLIGQGTEDAVADLGSALGLAESPTFDYPGSDHPPDIDPR